MDITSTYRMFNLITAANSFLTLGNSDDLDQYFHNSSNQTVRNAIKQMRRFSEEVALCRTNMLDSCLKALNESLDALKDQGDQDENTLLFQSISSVIRDKFQAEPDKPIDLLNVILWCLDNKMIQQAVTIYVEKMPEYIFQNGLIVCHCMQERLQHVYDNSKNNPQAFNDYYNLLYNDFLQHHIQKKLCAYMIAPLDVLDHIEIVMKDFKGIYSIQPQNQNELQQLLRDIYFIKDFVRNSLNHANNTQRQNNNWKKKVRYFKANRYQTENLNAAYITQIIRKSIQQIQQIQSQSQPAAQKTLVGVS